MLLYHYYGYYYDAQKKEVITTVLITIDYCYINIAISLLFYSYMSAFFPFLQVPRGDGPATATLAHAEDARGRAADVPLRHTAYVKVQLFLPRLGSSWSRGSSECASGARCTSWESISCSSSSPTCCTRCSQLTTCICGAGAEGVWV